MPLRLTYKGETSIPVEIEGLTPDSVCQQSLTEIERFEIFHGNRKIPLAEMFDLRGDPGDSHFEFEGDLSGVHWIGAHMKAGRIDIHGPAGRHLGSEMAGGQIVVHGDAGDWVGGELHGGTIHVHGNAGHLIGAAYRGSSRGMTGGTIMIDGNVGNEVGHTLRRGWIVVGGQAGDMLGFNMIAGTIFVLGECGIRPGAGMRRGTVCLFASTHPPLLPSFRHGCRFRPPFLPPMIRWLEGQGFELDEGHSSLEFDLHHGDFVALGKGEILLRC